MDYKQKPKWEDDNASDKGKLGNPNHILTIYKSLTGGAKTSIVHLRALELLDFLLQSEMVPSK